MFLAKALYDNVAETPDELAFRRGDVITVIEQDPGGLEGWWLCHLRDKQGIAPGNRLKILSGMIDKEKDKDNIYSSPKSSPRNSWDALKRTLKQLSTDSGLDLYDSPQKPKPVLQNSFIEDYDVPKGGTLKANKSNSRRGSLEHAIDDIYDVPKNNAPRVVLNTNTGNLSFSRAVSDPVSPMNVYDVPPQVTRDSVISAKSDSSEEGQRLSSCSTDSRLSDIPIYDELLLDLDSALERLVKVQQDVTKSINKLLSFVSSTWRKKESLETKLYEIKLACTNVKKSLSEFVRFSEGALGNSTKLADKKLVGKLYKQLNPIQNSLHMITAAMLCLEEDKWQVALLSEPLNSSKPDSLGQITTISKDLTVDVRKLASFIQGNSTLLFKRAYESLAEDIYSNEEYDYVQLETNDAAAHQKLKEEMENKSKSSPPEIPVKSKSSMTLTSSSSMESINLDPNDKQVLVYYGEQMDTHTTLLSNAIDAFLNCIESSEPPKVFISNSKFVVLSAHKLVYMGDTLHKNLINSQVRNRVMLCANHLCDVLKQSVVATKSAALQYPSVAAVQEMVDRIMDVSHAAHNMKVTISQSAAL
ncbi:hypothetical protein LOTGIDRAFT_126969 [Lottia gigantea]|uniref:Breast cancer anti-estrogen resistance protein 1 n=1 Tax=Lottia gigantea TaxID=225164 RepID=V3ZYT3_LOTGI|nr:hypothetical protein LOTGIDRAFT_126969 [Lottia gigantea]ESO87800.1 hypothetical protein LOTGIDRAFT_126969 [Lottia gigantea]